MSDQPEPPHPGAKMIWLWKSGDHYLAFDTPVPQFNGTPLVYGDPVAWAWVVPVSEEKS